MKFPSFDRDKNETDEMDKQRSLKFVIFERCVTKHCRFSGNSIIHETGTIVSTCLFFKYGTILVQQFCQ